MSLEGFQGLFKSFQVIEERGDHFRPSDSDQIRFNESSDVASLDQTHLSFHRTCKIESGLLLLGLKGQ